MDRLRELYQEVIIDHNRSPRNFGECAFPSHHSEGYNPLCGDRLSLDLVIENDVITDAKFSGSGCAISVASASLMTESLIGKRIKAAKKLFAYMHALFTEEVESLDEATLGKLVVLAGVKRFPARVKCASLAWHTFANALEVDESSIATTE